MVHHIRKTDSDGKHGGGAWLGIEDIRGSGRISDDARQILILQNVVDTAGGQEKMRYYMHIAKNSHGPESGKDEFEMTRVSNRCKFIEGGAL